MLDAQTLDQWRAVADELEEEALTKDRPVKDMDLEGFFLGI